LCFRDISELAEGRVALRVVGHMSNDYWSSASPTIGDHPDPKAILLAQYTRAAPREEPFAAQCTTGQVAATQDAVGCPVSAETAATRYHTPRPKRVSATTAIMVTVPVQQPHPPPPTTAPLRRQCRNLSQLYPGLMKLSPCLKITPPLTKLALGR
jgi:hypothetical protein